MPLNLCLYFTEKLLVWLIFYGYDTLWCRSESNAFFTQDVTIDPSDVNAENLLNCSKSRLSMEYDPEPLSYTHNSFQSVTLCLACRIE